MRRVVIIGIGVVSPVGIGVDAFWTGLSGGRSGAIATERQFGVTLSDEQVAPLKTVSDLAALVQDLLTGVRR